MDKDGIVGAVKEEPVFFFAFSQRLFRLFARGDVLKNAVDMLKPPLCIPMNFTIKRDQQRRTIFFDHRKLEAEDLAEGLQCGKVRREMVLPVCGEEFAEFSANDLFSGIA